MHYLARYPHSNKLQELLQLLIEKGGDVDIRESAGETPLHQAAFRGSAETVKFLIDRGAGLNQLNA